MSLKTLGVSALVLVLVCLMFQTMVGPFQADASPMMSVDSMANAAGTFSTSEVDVDSVSVLTATGTVGGFGNNPFLASFGNSPFLP